jgi:undecaprenyl-diphosphatase
MNLFELVKNWDSGLFLFINGHFSPFFDSFMFVVSEKLIWIPLYISVLFILLKNWGKEAIWLILALILCIVISDQIASGVFKNLIHRLRPSHALKFQGLVHLVKNYSGGKYGFASSHAANAVGFALLTSLILRHRIYGYFITGWALVVAYSRIYLGLHYPFDILGGVVIGILAALFCFWLLQKFRPKILKDKVVKAKNKNSFIPVIVLSISFLGIIVLSIFN